MITWLWACVIAVSFALCELRPGSSLATPNCCSVGPPSTAPLSPPPLLRAMHRCVSQVVKGFGILKKCAARINVANGTLDRVIGEHIIRVSNEIVEGKLDDHFPLVRCYPSPLVPAPLLPTPLAL